LECTNFSNAKGGAPRDADSRSLADSMPMYLTTLNPDCFTIENVREFTKWGPMEPKTGITKEGFPFCHLLPVFEGKGKKKKTVGYHRKTNSPLQQQGRYSTYSIYGNWQ